MARSSRLFLLATIFAVAAVPCVSAQVINMSHDLVSLGIASQNATPNKPTLDSRPLIQAAINYVYSHSVQTLTIDPGAYYMLSQSQSNAVLIIGGLSNLTVDFAGSTLYFQGPMISAGIQIYECTNVTLTNFSTDFITPPYTHVKVTAIDTVSRILTYTTLPGWPDPSSLNSAVSPYGDVVQYWGAIFRNGSILAGTSRTGISRPISNSQLIINDPAPWTQSATLATLEPGDTVVVTARAGGSPLLVWQSDTITLSNINVYGSPQFAVDIYASKNSIADHVSVKPRPGTGLIGSNADGIHFSTVGPNDHLRNCYVKGTLDDALIMDSQYAATVSTQPGTQEITVVRTGFYRFANGTAVNFIDPVSTLEIAGATIVSQNPADSNSPVYNGTVDITFDKALPSNIVGMGMVPATADLRGNGSTIEDNVAEDIYAGRGIWITGVEGVTVQRNVIRRTSNAGIIASQDTEAYPGPPAHDDVIQDNAVEGALGPESNSTGAQTGLAAIQVVSTNNQSFSFATASSNTDITIQNNYIADSGRSGIWLGELNGGTATNNLIARWYQQPNLPVWGIPGQFLTQVDADLSSAIVTHYDTGVTTTGNTANATSTVRAPVIIVPSNENVTAAGTTGSFGVTAAFSSFGWNAISDSAWLTVTSTSMGTGNGNVQYAVATNTNVAYRTGHVTVAGESFTVVQSGADLTVQPSRPSRPTLPAAGTSANSAGASNVRAIPPPSVLQVRRRE